MLGMPGDFESAQLKGVPPHPAFDKGRIRSLSSSFDLLTPLPFGCPQSQPKAWSPVKFDRGTPKRKDLNTTNPGNATLGEADKESPKEAPKEGASFGWPPGKVPWRGVRSNPPQGAKGGSSLLSIPLAVVAPLPSCSGALPPITVKGTLGDGGLPNPPGGEAWVGVHRLNGVEKQNGHHPGGTSGLGNPSQRGRFLSPQWKPHSQGVEPPWRVNLRSKGASAPAAPPSPSSGSLSPSSPSGEGGQPQGKPKFEAWFEGVRSPKSPTRGGPVWTRSPPAAPLHARLQRARSLYDGVAPPGPQETRGNLEGKKSLSTAVLAGSPGGSEPPVQAGTPGASTRSSPGTPPGGSSPSVLGAASPVYANSVTTEVTVRLPRRQARPPGAGGEGPAPPVDVEVSGSVVVRACPSQDSSDAQSGEEGTDHVSLGGKSPPGKGYNRFELSFSLTLGKRRPRGGTQGGPEIPTGAGGNPPRRVWAELCKGHKAKRTQHPKSV